MSGHREGDRGQVLSARDARCGARDVYEFGVPTVKEGDSDTLTVQRDRFARAHRSSKGGGGGIVKKLSDPIFLNSAIQCAAPSQMETQL